MAVSCAKCGAEVPAGGQFCAVCGTPVVGAGAAPPAASPFGSTYTPVNVPGQPATGTPPLSGSQPLPGYTPVAGAPPSGYPPSGYSSSGYTAAGSYGQPVAVQQKGGGALKIILIVLAVFVGLGILGAGAVGFMVWRVAHHFHVNGRDGQFTLNTPSGSVTASNTSNFTADELGTDIYPGAQATAGGMRMNLPSGSVVSGVFVTPDTKEQVLAFYKGKLGSDASVFDGGRSSMISLRKGSHESITISIQAAHGDSDGKTKISIIHTKNNHAS